MLIITNWKALNINIDNDLTHEVKNGRWRICSMWRILDSTRRT